MTAAVCQSRASPILALQPGFQQWAEPWGRLGLWLSLWDEQAECVEHAGSSIPFWHALTQYSPRFQQRLKSLASEALSGEATVWSIEPQCGLVVLVLPISHRQRGAGALLGCAIAGGMDEEGFARFCGVHELDRLVLQQLAVEVPPLSELMLRSYREILAQHLEAAGSGTLARRDVGDLSAHLAQAYEELNLLYRISTNLTVLRSPADHFQSLCEELLSTTVVESFAAVLEPPRNDPTQPTVVCAGPIQAAPADILRLYVDAQQAGRNVGSALLVNDVPRHPTFGWAGGWLERLVFFDLASKGRTFGGLLALNHVDGQDFGSEEARLINSIAERSSVFIENAQLYADLEQLFMGMLHALVSSIDAKDPYTCGHSQRVAWFSRHLASLAGLSPDQSQRVYLSGLLHDIGKIGISESVLRKAGRLTDAEFTEMRRHPAIGARILENVPQVQDVIPGVLHHHERFDGKGYPGQCSAADVPLMGRIIGLADSFDAMTTSRTYRLACPVPIAEAELRRCSGTQFDPGLVDLILRDGLADLIHRMNESDKQPVIGPLLFSAETG